MDPFMGEIKMVGFNFAPRGYVLCQGQTMAIQQNSALFALLGTTFGGDGVQTFGIPDYRCRIPVGMGNGPGLTPILQGEKSGVQNTTLLLGNMPMHNHIAQASVAIPALSTAATAAAPATNAVLAAANGSVVSNRDDVSVNTYATGTADTNLAPFNANVTVQPAGTGQPFSLLNPYLGTNFIIATQGVFPSRN